MKRLIEISNTRVVAVNGKQVLRQVITADRQEVDALSQILDLINSRRNFHHNADFRHLYLKAFFERFYMRTIDQVQRRIYFSNVADHRQHNTKIIEAFTGLHHGANLNQENLRVIEGNANAAPAEKRVCLIDREVRERLIPTDIQRTHRHRVWAERLQLLPINLLLLAL